ncbi:MAG TPA: ComEA family DNA-binding protein [Acholeplasma sp.]|nr:ComEA family DNA-binding protein [Acholeplasma sp.]
MKNRLLFILLVIVLFNLYFWPKTNEEEKEVFIYPEKYTITLMGEVVFPGSYYFFEPVAFMDVINYAGGFTANANLNTLNLNETLLKSTIIVVDKIVDTNEDSYPKTININTASFDELIKIDGITENRAANIILHREQYGLFKNINELINVKYIGEATFEKIKDYLTV